MLAAPDDAGRDDAVKTAAAAPISTMDASPVAGAGSVAVGANP